MTEHADRHHDLSAPDAPPVVEPGHPTGQGTDREIDATLISRSALALLLVTVLAMGAMWLMLRLFQGRVTRADRPPSPLAAANERRLPPGPLLQVTPEVELQAFRQREFEHLTTYGWIDRSRGIGHIPIERAMELLLAKGDDLSPATVPAAAVPAGEPAGMAPPAPAPAPAAPPGGHR